MSALFHKAVFHNNFTKRNTDITAKMRLARKSTAKNFICKSGGRGFAVCAGYCDIMLGLRNLIRKLNFRDNRNVVLLKLLHHRTSVGYARIFDDKVKITFKNRHILSDDLNIVFVKKTNFFYIFFFLALGECDLRTELFKNSDCRHAAACKSDNKNLFA